MINTSSVILEQWRNAQNVIINAQNVIITLRKARFEYAFQAPKHLNSYYIKPTNNKGQGSSNFYKNIIKNKPLDGFITFV